MGSARLTELIALTRSVQAEINRSEVGRIEEVLIERPARRPGQVLGRTRRGKVVAFRADECRVGRYTWVRLDSTSGATFTGSLVPASALGATG